MTTKSEGGSQSIETVPINALLPADSPRTAGTNTEHIRMLAMLDEKLSPIVVHRPTMRVIDGMHRLRAAELRGDRRIEVRFVGGSVGDAFVLAVALNHTHGLPLTMADRTAAAARIIQSHPEWSDRRIATITGLAATIVGAIRRPPSTADVPVDSRDVRPRPVNAAARGWAGELINDNPGASLRDIATAAGISPATARDVRMRLHRGESPIPPRDSDDVRTLLRLLETCALDAGQWERVLTSLPPHHKELMVCLVRCCAEIWRHVTDRPTGWAVPAGADNSVDR